jgi:hypothetical protein
MPINTRTVPEPHKTVKDLWLDLRVATAYSGIWERTEDAIAQTMERQINSPSPRNDDVRDAIGRIRASSMPRRPSIEDLDPDPGFRTEELGEGSKTSYWETQKAFPEENRQRMRQHALELAKLEKARRARIISRSVRG